MTKGNGLSIPSGNVMEQIGEPDYKYLWVLEMDKLMETLVYLRRFRLILKSTLNGQIRPKL